ncbi:ribonuclease P protein component [Dolosigranulum pigrum]|uniref:Ribonuclease P protein component n=2 Tax=Dolosigranulum TaxID=29393 RepID=A0A1S8KPC3_9LACT|nr:ribonuclease P protein component [Dolosigranulum pigrum]OOL81588.1 ribonuclease P protein component [Dolosigranulum pigrum]QJS95730.1 ribonuclease P protein component [Dolosigranulum pigrum]QTJ33717.1 ribonuclease P protein component [Dolosigranulum pigrum]QTJ37129.1 ribonuclease P protein component [Dolosigranulum pigrum]QTJ38895.1 ribonuclease P protein component [Dolosigranulum pigrum]
MKKAYRVKSESDFQYVFDQGRSVANRQFVIYWLKKPQQPHFRVGISVSKRLGNAVVRNQVKRKIRQAILECDQTQRLIHEVDFIVIARQPAVAMSVAECKQSLLHVLNLAQLTVQPKRN